MSERSKFRVGFYVEVEVESYDQWEAPVVAQAATGWPWARHHHDPMEVEGVINGKPVKAKVLRSEALMVKPVEEEG